ncbi:MAG: hypothetical protein RL085_961, partial [Actinomycetota bacterium]
AWLHAAAYRWRIRTAYQPSIATLAVGNLHVGGTGKTPLSLWLMEQLHQRVEPVYYVSRGYGRRTKEVREVVLEDAPENVGDEALMVRQHFGHSTDVHVVVAHQRTEALKRLGRDIEGTGPSKAYLATMDREAGFWDYLISPSAFCTEIFPGAFNYRGEIIETGYPRNDRLTKTTSTERQAIREKIGVADPSTIIVMYAPTWRDYNRSATGNWQSVNFMDENIELPEGFQMIYRGHTNTHAAHKDGVAGRAIDVTMYPDVTELYLAADVMITDFSSVMFDYTVTGKPILFLAPDLERYRAERGFYFDFENTSPGPILTSDDEVLQALGRIEQVSKLYEKRYREWQKKFNSLEDGGSAKRVVARVWG